MNLGLSSFSTKNIPNFWEQTRGSEDEAWSYPGGFFCVFFFLRGDFYILYSKFLQAFPSTVFLILILSEKVLSQSAQLL